ncbi:catalase family peroxidase [uncultured Azohydromonas sp.]|jgi:Catalase|uniref:catalase family peroxidase n=1 Tax=uncultured Azohydromonas sp. TaxID=487342 RepID=UPI00260EF5AF|nr:catalase family peroxidase [uncultured Azohydromonas sp.]
MTSPTFAAAACAALCASAAAVAAQPEAPADTPATAQALVDAFENISGKHPGFRRGGAKGLCAEGHFTGTTEGRALSSASAFGGERIPVVVRFSVTGGNPRGSDKARTTRGLALQFALPGGERWQMANISAPMNAVSTPEIMLRSLEARKPDPETKKPDPAKIKAFNEAYPETRAQADWLNSHGIPASYAAVNYWGVHAFQFTTAKGQSQYARWVFEPAGGQELLDDEKLKSLPDDFLADELRRRVAGRSAEFAMRLQLAEAGDNLVNPTLTWPESRKTVTVGRLVIDKVESGPGGACDALVFDPNVLPKGIAASDDPVLRARSGVYAVSAGRRLAGQ